MTLAKLTIKPRPYNPLTEIKVMFNPTSYSITKPVSYTPTQKTELDAPLLTFSGGNSRTLTLSLLFDVTEDPVLKDVRELTNKLVKLTRIERKGGEPPVCDIDWGAKAPDNSDFPFAGVVSNLTQEFNLFESDGRPLRANVTVTFTEFLSWSNNWRETDPEFTTHVIKRGDSLSSIAAEVYNDPRLWRVIAEANNLDDPRKIEIGRTLNIKTIS